MIVLPGNGLGLVNVGGLVHEKVHQWWGDNVSDADFDMTFFKEGMATLAVQLDSAHQAAQRAGGSNTTAGRAAFKRYLVDQFNSLYASRARSLAARAVAPHGRHLPGPLRRL